MPGKRACAAWHQRQTRRPNETSSRLVTAPPTARKPWFGGKTRFPPASDQALHRCPLRRLGTRFGNYSIIARFMHRDDWDGMERNDPFSAHSLGALALLWFLGSLGSPWRRSGRRLGFGFRLRLKRRFSFGRLRGRDARPNPDDTLSNETPGILRVLDEASHEDFTERRIEQCGDVGFGFGLGFGCGAGARVWLRDRARVRAWLWLRTWPLASPWLQVPGRL